MKNEFEKTTEQAREFAELNEVSPMQEIINNHYIAVIKERDNGLKEYVKKNLKQLGYEFETDTEFMEFMKKRITRLTFEANPDHCYLHLDYVDMENPGTLIGSYSDKVTFKTQGDTFSMTIGG